MNNAGNIKPHLRFDEEGDFYFAEIIKRRKDNPEMKKHVKILKYYYIYSLGQFDEVFDEIKEMCDDRNARFYIYLNKRNAKKVALRTLSIIASDVEKGDFKHVRRAYQSACGACHSAKVKKWLIDIDTNDLLAQDLVHTVYDLQEETGKLPMLLTLPTVSGSHLISFPFNLQKFKKEFPNVDVFKDAPTLVYFP